MSGREESHLPALAVTGHEPLSSPAPIVQPSGRTLEQVYAAIKINYSILGNIVPHVHAHIQPRFMATRTPVDR